MLGVKIDIEAKIPTLGKEIEFDLSEMGSSINILVMITLSVVQSTSMLKTNYFKQPGRQKS